MREIKFRAWDKLERQMVVNPNAGLVYGEPINSAFNDDDYVYMQYTGLKDKNGVEIYEGDILEFSDKWEWYRTSYGPKMMFADSKRREQLMKDFDAELMERRPINLPEDYEWLLSSEIQSLWEVIGNIYENPELLEKSNDQQV